jgi:hypothetical protein
MKTEQLQQYISQLLDKPTPSTEIMSEIPNVGLAVLSYMAGLQGKTFPYENLFGVNIEKEIPAQFHILIAQCAILKSKKGSNIATDYLIKNVVKYLLELQNYFTTQRR